jgi:hypothetical protein
MPGLVPGIHVLASPGKKDVDGRDKPGHDDVLRLKMAGRRKRAFAHPAQLPTGHRQ